ncbi:MAG: type II toxin-antitoxin system VapC family toxin [Gammaproteobacteria bacterium]|nr:type II toxin-antitoxin system VapC family toxin [Gammaproteobacteria bacterium]
MSVVFDSSAVLAIAFREHGANRAVEALGNGVLSAVNASEVVARLVERGLSDEDARESLHGFGLAIRPFDESLAITAGLLRRTTRTHGLSLGDRACLALARRERATVLTADRSWAALELSLEMEFIR